MKITGGCNVILKVEERVFWIKQFKKIKTTDPIEKRILKRTMMRLLRQSVQQFPLYPDKECPTCERVYAHHFYDVHVYRCKMKYKTTSFDVDKETLDRILHEN